MSRLVVPGTHPRGATEAAAGALRVLRMTKEEAERLNAMPPLPPLPAGHIDETGRTQQGKASFYAPSFSNKPMADGRPMDP
jgi:rare lipoprotein A (peptidoglycan hydrolase)